ncbi:MAG: sel1 repeat family protein, partial [Lachnospiraceae bacterium]|nr:sel1 repeat family protein [Lachnospiraceae bacterium]
MGKLADLFGKIPFIANFGNKRKPAKSNVELQYDKAINLMENGNAEEAVEILEKIVDIAIVDQQYKNFGMDALKIMAELFETGKYSNCTTEVDKAKACKYYEKYTKFSKDGEIIYKLAKMLLEIQNFSKAITYFEKATE